LRAGGVHELQGLAVRLRQVEAEFPGHVTGQAKADQLAEADLNVFPSSRESYGLTLDHAGARSLMRAEFGRMASADGSLPALQEMGRAAQAFALALPFADTAQRRRALLHR
jgi:hypothetical protein